MSSITKFERMDFSVASTPWLGKIWTDSTLSITLTNSNIHILHSCEIKLQFFCTDKQSTVSLFFCTWCIMELCSNNIILTLHYNTTCWKTYTFSKLTGAAEVHNFYCTAFGVAQKNVFRLEVAVDDVEFRRGEEQQSHTQLLRELSRQVQRDASEVGVA